LRSFNFPFHGSAIAASTAHAEAESRPLSLKEAVTKALADNPLLRETAEKINQAEAQIPVTRAATLPTLVVDQRAQLYRKDAASNSGAKFGGEPYNEYSSDLRVHSAALCLWKFCGPLIRFIRIASSAGSIQKSPPAT